METFAQTLSRLRSARDLPYARLAAAVPCSRMYLWQIETQGYLPERATAQAIDTALRAHGELLAALPPQVVMVSTPLTLADLPELRATAAHLAGLDTLHGSDGLHRRAEQLFTGYRRRLGRCRDADVRTEVANLGTIAEWLAYDAGKPEKGQRLLEMTLPLATGSPIEALCLDQLANIAYDDGAPADSLMHAQRGLAITPAGVVRGMFEVRAARALGLLGDEAEALAAMDRARGLIEAGPTAGQVPQGWWITWEDYLIHRGGLMLDLGRHREAIAIRGAAMDRIDNLHDRERGLCAGYLAVAHAAAGDRATALCLVADATATSTRVRRLFARVRKMCR